MSLKDREIQILAQARTEGGIVFQIRRDPKGVLEVPQLDSAILSIHVGAPARLSCRRNNRWSNGTAIHGDIDIIPAHTPSRWVMHDENDMAFMMSLPQTFLQSLAEDNARGVELRNCFQIRDPEIETLCWAVKREVETSRPSGPLYLEGLSLALASRLISQHSSIAKAPELPKGLSKSCLKDVLEFIEDQLAEDLRLAQIAKVAGVSVSHIKTLFSRSTGTPIHHYVVARRIERAKKLLTEDNLSISQIASECGFAHQSHLARHLRRATGMSPRALKRLFGEKAKAK
jgi:AraC family transcriptional regulator